MNDARESAVCVSDVSLPGRACDRVGSVEARLMSSNMMFAEIEESREFISFWKSVFTVVNVCIECTTSVFISNFSLSVSIFSWKGWPVSTRCSLERSSSL